MNENDLYNILQGDDNLREAIRRREQKLPPMPASLKEKPLQPTPAPIPGLCPPTRSLSPKEGRIKSLPSRGRLEGASFWGRLVGAAACLLIIIGIGVALIPSKESSDSGEFAIRQGGVGDLKSPEAIKNHRMANPNTQDSRITNSTEPKAMAVAESKGGTPSSGEPKAMAVAESTTIRKPKKKAVPIQTASIEQNDSSVASDERESEKLRSPAEVKGNLITSSDIPLGGLGGQPAVLTERDIPITRPENYRYTPEEIALLKKQADEAYVKWVQLELEIAKHNLEQTANNYKEL